MIQMFDYIQYLGYFFVFLGSFFIITATIGLWRLPNFLARLHAVTLLDSLGIPLSLIGFIIIKQFSFMCVKILLLIIVLWVTGTSASYVLAQSFYKKKKLSKNLTVKNYVR